MFYIFDWFIYSHPRILISLGSCALPCILASSYPYVCVYLIVSAHPYILVSSGSYALTCIPASSYPQVRVGLLVSLHPRILISLGSCVLVGILTSSHPQVHVCVLIGILASSYPQVHVCLLVSSHSQILVSSGLRVLASNPQVNVFSVHKNNFILASSSLLVLSNCASQYS